MKKSLFLASIAIITAFSSLLAQDDVRIGVTGGLINSNTSVNLSVIGFDLLDLNAINKFGFYVGAIGDVAISEKFHA